MSQRKIVLLIILKSVPSHERASTPQRVKEPKVSTHDDQKDKINPVPKGMSVLHVVHYIRPALQTYHLRKQRNAVKGESVTGEPRTGGGGIRGGDGSESAQIIAFNLGCREEPSLAARFN